MDELTQSAKELLAINILKEFGCFEEVIRLSQNTENPQPLTGLPKESIEYLTSQMQNAMNAIDEAL